MNLSCSSVTNIRKTIFASLTVPAVDALPAPGTTFKYSNVGYSIAAAVEEKVTGKSWEDLMTNMLFKPLGMTTAGFGPMASGYRCE